MKTDFLVLVIIVLVALSSCGESNEEAYQRGEEVGYNNGWLKGTVDVCYEVKEISPELMHRLDFCRGLL